MRNGAGLLSQTSVHAALAWAVLTVSACGAPQAEPPPIDMDYELNVLYGCALSTLESAGYSIDWREDGARMAATEWRELRAGERHRASVAVALHPSYGPGATARLHVESRAADGSADPPESVPDGGSADAAGGEASPGWRRVERSDDHTDWEEGYLQEVQACWRDTR
jgi:hypothetical protein